MTFRTVLEESGLLVARFQLKQAALMRELVPPNLTLPCIQEPAEECKQQEHASAISVFRLVADGCASREVPRNLV